MTIAPQKAAGRPKVRPRGILAIAAIAAILLPLGPIGPSVAGKSTIHADSIPLPRPNPRRANPPAPAAAPEDSDTIGALITAEDQVERSSSEDSDNDIPATVSEQTPALSPPPAGPYKSEGLRKALEFLDDNDPADATIAAYALPNRVDIKLVNWMIATGGYHAVSSTALAKLRASLTDWPSQSLMQIRYEQALVREAPSPATVIAALGKTKPQTDDATLLLARAYLAAGRKGDAERLIRDFWRNESFSLSTEKTVVAEFHDLWQASDNKYRMDRLLYAERSSEALRTAKRLDGDQQALADAVVLVIKRSSKAGKALDALPAAVKHDPLYTYSRIQYDRRANKIDAAAKLLLAAPRDPNLLVDPDAWWVERRLISRELIDDGDAKRAYLIAAGHSAESPTLRAEAEFHAGWYALEFLHDPQTAARHFAKIGDISTRALSASRAEYWMGRAAEAAGDVANATAHYRNASAYPTAFYGQLAIARMGGRRLPLSVPAEPTPQVRNRFESRELVQVIHHLTTIDEAERTGVFFRALAETLTDPTEVAMLAKMAEDTGLHTYALQVGKAAAARGLPVDALAFPTAGIPASARLSDVERPLVYAIARQESAFNANAVSGAGARGLLQMMPATAQATAKTIGLPYSKTRLTSDPSYNATLGAAHLASLVDRFGGSYVMMFAAYNAGGSRVDDWVNRHGDPRDPKVDTVDWIELIPFTETRNYVQRIMENLQVYRARFGGGILTIEADLKAGRAPGE